MQQVLNIIWEKFLPAMNDKALSEDPVAFAQLQKKMSSLKLPLVKKISCSCWWNSWARLLHLKTTKKDLSQFQVQDRDDHTFLKLENAHGTQYIYFTRHLWVEDEIVLEKNLKQAVGSVKRITKNCLQRRLAKSKTP